MASPAGKTETFALSVNFGRRVALDRVTLSFDSGLVGVLGPNGAGKSTLLSVLATTLRVGPGVATVAGNDVGTSAGRRSAREVLGWLPQRFDLAGGMTLLNTVAYCAWSNGQDAKAAPSLAVAALRRVGLEDRAPERVRTLSGGQRQRLGLAGAIAHEPSVLLLDEPTVGLDPEQRVQFRESVRRTARSRVVLLSSHLLEDITHMADSVVVLAEGKVLFTGTPKDLADVDSVEGSPADPSISPQEAGYLNILRHGR